MLGLVSFYFLKHDILLCVWCLWKKSGVKRTGRVREGEAEVTSCDGNQGYKDIGLAFAVVSETCSSRSWLKVLCLILLLCFRSGLCCRWDKAVLCWEGKFCFSFVVCIFVDHTIALDLSLGLCIWGLVVLTLDFNRCGIWPKWFLSNIKKYLPFGKCVVWKHY